MNKNNINVETNLNKNNIKHFLMQFGNQINGITNLVSDNIVNTLKSEVDFDRTSINDNRID